MEGLPFFSWGFLWFVITPSTSLSTVEVGRRCFQQVRAPMSDVSGAVSTLRTLHAFFGVVVFLDLVPWASPL